MDIEYRYFAKVWGSGGPSHGSYDYILLESKDYDLALKEIQEINNLDTFNPLAYHPTDFKTHRILSRWEMDNRKK